VEGGNSISVMDETNCSIRELELSSDEMRKLIQQATERIVEHIESLPSQPVSDVTGGEDLARSVVEPMPEQGVAFTGLLELLFGRLVPKTFNTASPGDLA